MFNKACLLKKKNKALLIILAALLQLNAGNANSFINGQIPLKDDSDSLPDVLTGPWVYSENFEEKGKSLSAWASYPLWQDNAYDPNLRVDCMVPGDPNLSIVQKVTPYSHVDNYAGVQKLLSIFLLPDSKISFKYYVKANQEVEYLKVRLAAGSYGKLDVTIPHPKRNEWISITLGLNDFTYNNPNIKGKERVKVSALAFLAKFPDADPAMPVYLGIDDINIQAAKEASFDFVMPDAFKLPEYDPFITKKKYIEGDMFELKGSFPFKVNRVDIEIISFVNESQTFYKGSLRKAGNLWELQPIKINFPAGLYMCRLVAQDASKHSAHTDFTLHVVPGNMRDRHPRLLFDNKKKEWLLSRLKSDKYKNVFDEIVDKANTTRKAFPLDKIVYDLDQFPDENWLPSWNAFGSHIYSTGNALEWNALAYCFNNDLVAGQYAKDILVKLSEWPTWISPWMINRGRFSEHRMGSWSHHVALAYDLTFNLMTEEERVKIREAIINKIIRGVYQTYVVNNEVTSNTSNWIGHTVGGALMNIAAIFEDDKESSDLELLFAGCMIKFYDFIKRVTDSKDGSWGEGWGYNNYTFQNMSYSIPSLHNVFNIDVSLPLNNSYKEFIWAGSIKDKKWFGFGDSNNEMTSATNWKFLIDIQRDPLLNWFYKFLKENLIDDEKSGDDYFARRGIMSPIAPTFRDLLVSTKDIPEKSPFSENPVKAFRKVGTTVFKSGWEKDDFVFVMRTGSFFNHQHLDQGSFYLADKGQIFVEDQPIRSSDYYDDPLYQSDFTQPIAHSTILIDNNHQSQRVGDPVDLAPGFNDHAFIADFLDGKYAAFSRGDIGRLYWDKINSLSRNVLYIKPGAVLMLDEIVPGKKDVDVNLLYHTSYLKDIEAGRDRSTITKGNNALNLVHLFPKSIISKAVETPHYLKTLLGTKPLTKEGMLTVTARTQGKPMVIANLLTVTSKGTPPDVTNRLGDGYASGEISGMKFAYNTAPGKTYRINDWETDALAMVWSEDRILVAHSKVFRNHKGLSYESALPVTVELFGDSIRYSMPDHGRLIIDVKEKPVMVLLNERKIKNFQYNSRLHHLTLDITEKEGDIVIKYKK